MNNGYCLLSKMQMSMKYLNNYILQVLAIKHNAYGEKCLLQNYMSLSCILKNATYINLSLIF